ncbi:MAG TPA: hypothetical protein VHH73_18250 [Verrucomicrobiae bacterium]|nr:hypothetical protein [Verrucomicrobiae bacterium]
MLETPPNAELMRSLGRLVRGLSALFWGLPLTLLLSVRTALTDFLRPLGLFPALMTTGMLFYGLTQLAHFQRQERVWLQALERAKLLAVANIGLAPFLYWWNKAPQVDLFAAMVGLMMACGLGFLFFLNQVLYRLAALLPDEALRVETRFFTALNRALLLVIFGVVLLYNILAALDFFPLLLAVVENSRQLLVVFLVLLPVSMTMTLIWKTKEVILTGVFGRDH